MTKFLKNILPAILAFLGVILGVYLTPKLDYNYWKERTQYEQQLKVFEKKLNLIEQTTTIAGRMPSTSDLFNVYFDTSQYNKLSKEEQILLSEKLGNSRAEFRSIMFLNQIYFKDSTRSKIQKYLATDKNVEWWNIPDSSYNDIVQTMARELNTSTDTNTLMLKNTNNAYNGYLWLLLWVISLCVLWKLKRKLSSRIETQARYFLIYFLLTSVLLITFKGKDLGIPNEYLSNLTTEIIGIIITVFLIDRIYHYIKLNNETFYRKLSLKACRMPIYTYCANWFEIFEPNNKKLDVELEKHKDLSSFFKSDEFYNRVVKFNFNDQITSTMTYAQYYNDEMLEVATKFQSILAKYASKLSIKDIKLLEHFGGGAYFFIIFNIMKFMSDGVKFSIICENEPAKNLKSFNNIFKDVDRKNFDKHFDKLIELINEYNNAVEHDYDKWTVNNISKLHTIESANKNPVIEW